MSLIQPNAIKATRGNGEIEIKHLLTPEEMKDSCKMFAIVTIPPGHGIAYHQHNGNSETYHILQGRAKYNDNGEEKIVGVGMTTFCPDGEFHGIENIGSEDLKFIALIINY